VDESALSSREKSVLQSNRPCVLNHLTIHIGDFFLSLLPNAGHGLLIHEVF